MQEKELDAEALAEALAEEKEYSEVLKSFGKKKEPKSHLDYGRIFYPEALEEKKEEENLPLKNPFAGLGNALEQEIPAPKEAGAVSWIKANPVISVLAGAVIVTGAVAMYRYFTLKKETSEGSFTKRKAKRRTKAPAELSGEQVPMGNPAERIYENEPVSVRPFEEPKPESMSRENLGLSVTCAIAGNIAGAALGNASLITAIPLAIAGFKTGIHKLAFAAAGMAMAGGYRPENKEENKEGNFIERMVQRVKQFFSNLFDKFSFFGNKEEKPMAGFHKTILGYIHKSRVNIPAA